MSKKSNKGKTKTTNTIKIDIERILHECSGFNEFI